MTATVFCHKLQRQEAALTRAPYPGAVGQKILAEISAAAWQQWLAHQTMLINENRLSPLEPKTRAYLLAQMQAFLFGDGADSVAGFVPPPQ
jgi:Fe-S cluster biosynthesis and repair protein YggX